MCRREAHAKRGSAGCSIALLRRRNPPINGHYGPGAVRLPRKKRECEVCGTYPLFHWDRGLLLGKKRQSALDCGGSCLSAFRARGDGVRIEERVHQSACGSSGRALAARIFPWRWRPAARSCRPVRLRPQLAQVSAASRRKRHCHKGGALTNRTLRTDRKSVV